VIRPEFQEHGKERFLAFLKAQKRAIMVGVAAAIRTGIAEIHSRADDNLNDKMVRNITGHLKNSLKSRFNAQAGYVDGVVWNDAAYALAVHEGSSKTYKVEAKNAKALMIPLTDDAIRNAGKGKLSKETKAGRKRLKKAVAGGDVIFRKSATIPPRAGKPFLRDAFNDVEPMVAEGILYVLSVIARGGQVGE